LAPEIKGQTIPFSPSVLTYTSREPVGVVGAIIPVRQGGSCTWLLSVMPRTRG
jgi:acyl-CoA reductase-like NAD-dependent aldehyde dehydrogenase